MRAAIDGILLSADLRHLTRYNEILFPEFQRFHRVFTDDRKWNERPSGSFSAKYVGEEGGVRFGLYHLDYSSTHSKKGFWERACVSSRIH